MFERIKKLYQNGELSIHGLARAVHCRLITEEQFQEICNMSYDSYNESYPQESEE